jgi:hypothetical protein
MPESVAIPLDLLAETRQALDAALRLTFQYGAQNDAAHEAARQVHQAKAKIDEVTRQNSDIIQPDKRQEGYQLLRHLDEVRRKVKKDYGIEK